MTKTKDKKTGIYKVTFKTEHGRRTMSTGCTNEKDADLFIKKSKVHELEITARAVKLTPQIVNQIVVGKRVTMEKAVADWQEWLTVVGRSPRTIDNHRIVVAAWIRDKKLDKLSPGEITERQIHDWINGSDTKLGTRQVSLAAIRSFFECCAAKCYCIGNPSLAVNVQMSGMTHAQKETQVKTVFTAAEYKRLMGLLTREKDDLLEKIAAIEADMKGQRNASRALKTFGHRLDIAMFWWVAVPVARWTGLRLGDICQLEWDCFSQVDRANVWTDKRDRRVSLPLTQKEFLKDIKANKLDLPAKTKAAALAWIAQLENELVPVIGAIPIKNQTYCFPEARETITDTSRRSRLSSQFAGICERAQMPQHSFHDFRHTYCTELDRIGLPIEHISRGVGHASTQTTAHYIH